MDYIYHVSQAQKGEISSYSGHGEKTALDDEKVGSLF